MTGSPTAPQAVAVLIHVTLQFIDTDGAPVELTSPTGDDLAARELPSSLTSNAPTASRTAWAAGTQTPRKGLGMTDDDTVMIGRRLREIRVWRGLSVRAAAELAGFGKSYWSRIERCEQPVERKSTLEAFAAALRVSPADLTGQPFAPADPREQRGHEAIEDLRGALRDIELGVITLASVGGRCSYEELRHDVDWATACSDSFQYDELGAVLPGVLTRVWAHVGHVDGARTLLIECLHSALSMAKGLGYRDAAWSVAGHLHRAAEGTENRTWIAMADYWRADAMIGARSRERSLDMVTQAAAVLTPDSGPAGEVYGMLRLSAALQSAVSGAVDDVEDYLGEAEDIARHTGDGSFARMDFGPNNVSVWRTALSVEVGDVERVPALARHVNVEALPLGRRVWFQMDLGRGLAATRGAQRQAVEALCLAEAGAPQLVHANPFVRETVTDLLRRTPQDAGGRELRGLAYRMRLGA